MNTPQKPTNKQIKNPKPNKIKTYEAKQSEQKLHKTSRSTRLVQA